MAEVHADEHAEVARTNIAGKRKTAEYKPSGIQVTARAYGSISKAVG
jgi:hypothetical protein